MPRSLTGEVALVTGAAKGGLPLGQFPGLFAQKLGYGGVSYVTVDPGSDANVDIELARRQ